MTIKIKGIPWNCGNSCKANCCSEIFLPLPTAYRDMFEEHGYWIANSNYSDWRWMEFHKEVKTEKMDGGSRKIWIDHVNFDIIFNPFQGYDEIHIHSPCSMLLPDNKCKVFRSRPEICKRAECIFFSKKPELRFYAEYGMLRDKLKEAKV